ncbi:reverse transcriptase domain-containing protein [Tanacetum coccineum]
MEDDFKPVIQPQRQLNPKVQDAVKNEIVKLLDFGLIYPISDSSWVSPIHVVSKKGGMTVVLNDNNELIPSRTVTGWRVCIDYQYLLGIKVDRARIDVIAKLPYPTNVKGAILGQRIDGKFKPIYYASKTLNNAQEHYTTSEKELLVVVFSFDKFRLYLIKTVVYIDHSALKYLFSKQDAKSRLIRLENADLGVFTEEEIFDEFPDERLMILKVERNDDEPWYADYVNYIVGKIMPLKWTPDRRRRFLSQVKNYFWDEPYAFRPTEGHHSASITRRNVYKSGFFWPSIFKDAKDYVMRCDACQRSGNISSRNEMPQNSIQRSVGYNLKDWSKKLNNALWAFRTAYKTPTGCTPFRLVYGKACHLPVEIEHKAYWALKQSNIDLEAAAKNRFMELNELMELRDGAYENTRIYKERTKRWHD